MEKGGWLDQIIEFVLNVLTNRWLGYFVAFVGGAVVACLARRSPKQDWEYIKEGPGKLLLGAFFVSVSLRTVPRVILPETRFVCDKTTGLFGLPETSNCRFKSEGEFRTVIDFTFGDTLKEFVWGTLQEFVIGGIGALVGLLIAAAIPTPSAAVAQEPPNKCHPLWPPRPRSAVVDLREIRGAWAPGKASHQLRRSAALRGWVRRSPRGAAASTWGGRSDMCSPPGSAGGSPDARALLPRTGQRRTPR